MNKFNNKYTDVEFENKKYRVYNELNTDSYDALYSETQIKLIELINKYNFKVFYFSCSPKLTEKLVFQDKWNLNLKNTHVIKIKKFQCKDLMFLYKQNLFEVLYTIPKVTESTNYYFDFILVVNNLFDINKIYKNNFNLINIENVNQIHAEFITFDLIKSIFEKRTILYDYIPFDSSLYYDLSKINISTEKFIKEYNNNLKYYDIDQYINVNSKFFYKAFDQNKYIFSKFNILKTQIWSMDKIFYKKINKFGYSYFEFCEYNINSLFLTNFAGLINAKFVEINDKPLKIENQDFTYSTLSDNFSNQNIIEGSLSLEFLKNKSINFNDLKIWDEKNN